MNEEEVEGQQKVEEGLRVPKLDLKKAKINMISGVITEDSKNKDEPEIIS